MLLIAPRREELHEQGGDVRFDASVKLAVVENEGMRSLDAVPEDYPVKSMYTETTIVSIHSSQTSAVPLPRTCPTIVYRSRPRETVPVSDITE